MKKLSSYLSEGFFDNIGNNRDVELKKAIQNFDMLIKDCVELLKDIVSNWDKDEKTTYPLYTHTKRLFDNSKQYEKLKDVFKFLMENREYSIIVSTESDGKRDIKPGEFKAFREYGVNVFGNHIVEMPTLREYAIVNQALDRFFRLLFAYALDINTKDLGLSGGNFKIQDIYLVKC